MSVNYWHKQSISAPLFKELEWSKPENKLHAGKLLIIGGNMHGFSAPANAFIAAEKAGIGSVRVVLPSAIQKAVKTFIPEADFAPSTPSGSFAVKSLDTLLAASGWADGVLLAGDVGRNSETAVVIESFITKFHGQLTVTKDALDYVISTPQSILERENTLLVGSLAQLQKLCTAAASPTAITYDMGIVRLVEALHEFTLTYPLSLITKYHDQYVAAVAGQVSTTKESAPREVWRVETASRASVWWLQIPEKPFESLTLSLTY